MTHNIVTNSYHHIYGRFHYEVLDAVTNEVLDDYTDSNVVVLGAREPLIQGMISNSSNYRLSHIIFANDVAKDTPVQHRVKFSEDLADGLNTTLDNDSTEYTIDITIDGSIYTITILGQDAQTFSDLETEVENELSGLNVLVERDGDEFVVKADDQDPTRIVEYDIDTDELFQYLNTFDQFLDPINFDSPQEPEQDYTYQVMEDNSTILYDEQDTDNPENTIFGSSGPRTIIVNQVVNGQKVLEELNVPLDESVQFTSAVVMTNDDIVFAYERFPRLSISNAININVVWEISYEPFS